MSVQWLSILRHKKKQAYSQSNKTTGSLKMFRKDDVFFDYNQIAYSFQDTVLIVAKMA